MLLIGGTFALPAILAGCAPQAALPSPPAKTSDAVGSTTIVLTDFSFTPDRITLRAGVRVRLRLVNQSDGGHDFSAPALFAASGFAGGSPPPPDGTIGLAPHQTVEIALTPRVPGTYPVECTHFLHTVFGMTATVQVVP